MVKKVSKKITNSKKYSRMPSTGGRHEFCSSAQNGCQTGKRLTICHQAKWITLRYSYIQSQTSISFRIPRGHSNILVYICMNKKKKKQKKGITLEYPCILTLTLILILTLILTLTLTLTLTLRLVGCVGYSKVMPKKQTNKQTKTKTKKCLKGVCFFFVSSNMASLGGQIWWETISPCLGVFSRRKL